METLTIKAEDVKNFFNALWSSQEGGFLSISTDSGRNNGLSHKFFSHPLKLDLLLNALDRWVGGNVWFTLGLIGGRPQQGRGRVSDVTGLPGIVADIDCQGGVHNEKNLPTKEEALRFISELPFKPSMIIWSGGGFQVYWLFDEPWILEDAEDREKASDLSHRWQRFILSRGKEHGWKIDSVGSLEHLFRIPGLYNCKADPVPVEIAEMNDFRYSVQSIQEFLDDLPQEQPRHESGPGVGSDIGMVDCLSFSIKHLIQNGAEKGARSEAIGSVLSAMCRANVPENEIISTFESEAIGEKYLEKGSGRIKWLQDEIARTRDFVASNKLVVEWREPEPIKAELKPVEPLREEMIPTPFLPMVKDVCHRMSIPLDFVAIPIVIVAGSVIGTGCRVKPKRHDDWAIVPNLWGGIMGPPSRLKSPALEEVVKKQLGRLEAEEIEKHKSERAEWLRDMEAAKLRKSVLVSEYKNALKGELKRCQTPTKS